MNKKAIAISLILAILAASLVTVSCANSFVDNIETQADISVSGDGVLSLTLSGVASAPAARTIVPGASDIVLATYDVTLSRAGYASKTATFTSPTVTGDIPGVEAGEWTITVNGKTSGGVIIASGTSTITVALPGPTAATVSLAYTTADASNSGSIDITLLFPKSVGITGVEATLDGDAVSPALTVSDNGDTNNKVVCTLSGITLASPLLRIQLKKGSATMLYWAERIWVYKNITTTNVSTLASTDFELAPPAPVSLSAALQADGSVSLSWPNVEIAESYTMERSSNDGLSYSEFSSAIVAGATSFSDIETIAGQRYLYRISATNPFGTSDYTVTESSILIQKVISTAGIVDVTAPVKGITPVNTITATDQYTGTVTWSGTPVIFAPGTSYTATITLTAKTGYLLTGVAADFFTVSGATSHTNSADSGVISVLFPSTAGLAIGDAYQGGKVAYILVSGDPGYDAAVTKGLIAATIDQSSGIIWSIADKQTTSVPGGAVATAFGTGQANTSAIVAQNGEGITYAAGLCDAYTNTDTGTGVYSDWYLPSRDELNKLYLNYEFIDDLGGNYYWNSSEFNASNALTCHTTAGYQTAFSKSATRPVRAVRSF